jgi:hypothetical protein
MAGHEENASDVRTFSTYLSYEKRKIRGFVNDYPNSLFKPSSQVDAWKSA